MKGQKGFAIVPSISWRRPLPSLDLGMLWLRLRRWQQLARERRQLAMLDDAALKDLGLSRTDVLQESERPFWDDPLKR
ncbi:DUF1127 domain-containing protein [Pseudomonas sp. CAU 1711]|uniref:DUF1127 domain-containing protein n=1 Tax=Pseudomonas sp. CAU 1711 TaxID=3140356 RepID=UPI003260555B